MKELDHLQEVILSEVNAALLGQDLEVLVDGYKKGKWHGRTRTDKLVFFQHQGEWLGQLVNVRITQASPWALQGALVAA
jgi:tRNA-2-methylthio-N6-dimethylallyladenosine synthase